MSRPYRFIAVERRGDVFCVRLRQTQLDEAMIQELAEELRDLIVANACRKLAVSLGPESPECLYSVFLAKLICLQRVLREREGELVLCDVQPDVYGIFTACCLEQLFRFVPDFNAAVAHWTP
jgi:hypothetical protein